MQNDIGHPLYTLPNGAFALPVDRQKQERLASSAFLLTLIPPEPLDLYAWIDDSEMLTGALSLWEAIVEDSASVPALLELAENTIVGEGGEPHLAPELLRESEVFFHHSLRALQRTAEKFRDHTSIIPAEAARFVSAALYTGLGPRGKQEADFITNLQELYQRNKFQRNYPTFRGEHWHSWVSFENPPVPSRLVSTIYRAVWHDVVMKGRFYVVR